MDTESMKNMVILKNLPSNIVDEAIVILKPNIKLKSLDIAENKKNNKSKKIGKQSNKKYIINEAEMLIGSYISEMKCKRLKIISVFLVMALLVSFLIK